MCLSRSLLVFTPLDLAQKSVPEKKSVPDDESDSDDEPKTTVDDPEKNNDDLLYDPDEEEEDEKWMNKERVRSRGGQEVDPTSIGPTDAVLNCPGCMVLLSHDCQRWVSILLVVVDRSILLF